VVKKLVAMILARVEVVKNIKNVAGNRKISQSFIGFN
jgi:hypothetical protein